MHKKKAHGILLGHNGDILKRQPVLLLFYFDLSIVFGLCFSLLLIRFAVRCTAFQFSVRVSLWCGKSDFKAWKSTNPSFSY